MSLSKTLRREVEVAFSKNAQPLWFRISKYIVFILLICFLWDSLYLYIIFGTLFALVIPVHLWYRYKTKGWTQSYGGWDHEKNRSKLN